MIWALVQASFETPPGSVGVRVRVGLICGVRVEVAVIVGVAIGAGPTTTVTESRAATPFASYAVSAKV